MADVLVGMRGAGWLTFDGRVTSSIDEAATFTPEAAVMAALDPESLRALAHAQPEVVEGEAKVVIMEVLPDWEATRVNARKAVGHG